KHRAPDTFIHLGWGNVYQPHHECHVNENLQDGINLIDEFYNVGTKRIILIGSSSEYGDRQGSLKESYLPSGEINNYVKGKIALSKYGLERIKKTNQIFIHIRLFYTYGAGQKHNSLINQLFQKSITGGEMSLSPCEHYRDYIHVTDAAMGISRIVEENKSGIINLGSGKVILLKDFVKLFWKELSANSEKLIFGSHDVPKLEQSQPKSFADLTILKNRTNWTPPCTIEDGIKKTVEKLRLST
ncbi:NAD(P)-dependent oxidoreductase, partial [Alphaproteobacteria bacterium]|nr:NAD(P)-dependent oxidoreductase [Alphaproteobacteria bacterium]